MSVEVCQNNFNPGRVSEFEKKVIHDVLITSYALIHAFGDYRFMEVANEFGIDLGLLEEALGYSSRAPESECVVYCSDEAMLLAFYNSLIHILDSYHGFDFQDIGIYLEAVELKLKQAGKI